MIHRACPSRPAVLAATLLASLCVGLASATPTPQAGSQTVPGLGTLTFPTGTASVAAQDAFVRGMLLLHLFEYPAAARAFRQAQAADPGLAMAYWGEAMTFNHPVWNQLDAEAGRAALAKFAPTAAARAARASDPRQRAWLAAVEILYDGAGTKPQRDRHYADAMQALSRRYPDDESELFFALATLGQSEGSRDVPGYLRAAAIAQTVFSRNPRHPGAAHYWIHGMDDPQHAAAALPAARALSQIAPDAGHAQHMCSHIFIALGMWPQVVESNEQAVRVVDQQDAASGLPPLHCGHYALWLEYAYLQQGRVKQAEALLDSCFQSSAARGEYQRAHAADASASPARISGFVARNRLPMRNVAVIETEAWTGVDAQRPIDPAGLGFLGGWDAFARGYAAAGAGDYPGAEAALARLRAISAAGDPEDAYEGPDRISLGVMADELTARIAARQGHLDSAIATLRGAVATWDRQPFDFGPPALLKPPQELLGELLLANGDPQGAIAAFRASLSTAPNRSLSLLGLARAQTAAADKAAARVTWQALLAIWISADPGMPQLAEARSALNAM